MSGPGVAFIFVEPVEPTHVLGKAHGLEGAHVLPAGENVCAVHFGVDLHDGPGHELFFVKLKIGKD